MLLTRVCSHGLLAGRFTGPAGSQLTYCYSTPRRAGDSNPEWIAAFASSHVLLRSFTFPPVILASVCVSLRLLLSRYATFLPISPLSRHRAVVERSQVAIVIDDEPQICRAVQNSLKADFDDVLIAGTGQEGVDLA